MTLQKPALLQLLPFSFPHTQERLSKHFDVIELWNEPDAQAVIEARKDEIAVLVTSAMTPTRADLIDKLSNLKVICSQGVGYDANDVKHAQQKGIQGSNTPDVLKDSVAELAFGLLMATSPTLGHADASVRRNQWGHEEPYPPAPNTTQ